MMVLKNVPLYTNSLRCSGGCDLYEGQNIRLNASNLPRVRTCTKESLASDFEGWLKSLLVEEYEKGRKWLFFFQMLPQPPASCSDRTFNPVSLCLFLQQSFLQLPRLSGGMSPGQGGGL